VGVQDEVKMREIRIVIRIKDDVNHIPDSVVKQVVSEVADKIIGSQRKEIKESIQTFYVEVEEVK
jgi:hypothetical protein